MTASMFCACDACLLFDFGNCEMAAQMGKMADVKVPLKKGEVARTNQINCLVEWGKLLKPGMVVAVRAAAHEVDLEGPYWLLLVESEPFKMAEDMAHSTDEFEEGWLVVRGRFYSLVQKSPRGYQLTKASRAVSRQHNDSLPQHYLCWWISGQGTAGVTQWCACA